MKEALKSVFIWSGLAVLVFGWLPVLAMRRLFDRDPSQYHTGRLFRKLGKAMSGINPNWSISISGNPDIDDRHPYVVVCNHLSQADIPVISNLPWELKWIAKKELFDLPVVGWMMKMAGDISVDRSAINRKRTTLKKASAHLDNNCSVMFFPEGTRSRTGKLNRFATGAFELAIRKKLPILPLVIDGTQNALPKQSWKFGVSSDIRLHVFEPVDSSEFGPEDVDALRDRVRILILDKLSEWREENPDAIDGTL